MTPGRPARMPVAHRAQAIGLSAALDALKWLGPVRASNLGGWVARQVGPRLGVSRTADRNLRRALPEMTQAGRDAVVRSVWDNLGRTAAELPHLGDLHRTAAGPGWEISGIENLQAARDRQAVFVSGHFGNWEMILPIASLVGVQVAGVYRAGSNAGVDGVIQARRAGALATDVSMIPKGRKGARLALDHLRHGRSLGFLADQKMNDGIAAPFFGRDAMTAAAPAKMALRFGCPIIPVLVQRLGPARFRLVCEKPLVIAPTGSREGDIQAITCAINATLERWIRADPGAWLWLHRRWPKA